MDHELRSLAFPYGHFTPAVIRAMHSRYPLQYTVNPGYWDGHSSLIPHILISHETDRLFYFDYLDGALAGPGVLTMREPNGSCQSVIHFESPDGLDPDSLYIRSSSPDYDGLHYTVHAAGPFMSADDTDDNVLIFDIKAYLETHHSVERRALSFAVTWKMREICRFVSDVF